MRIWSILCFGMLLAPASGQEVSVPQRPEDYVLDQTGKVTPEERADYAQAMTAVAARSGLGIYAVILNSEPEEPPPDLAGRLAQGWSADRGCAVILTGPGMVPPVVLAVAGQTFRTVKGADFRAITGEALQAADGTAPSLSACKAVALRLAGLMEELPKAARPPSIPEAVTGEAAAPPASNHVMAIVAGTALGCSLIALVLMRRGRHSAHVFPKVPFRRRFSAPHSGGNDAVVSFKKP